jgi:gamma-glutamyl phosphate reductase
MTDLLEIYKKLIKNENETILLNPDSKDEELNFLIENFEELSIHLKRKDYTCNTVKVYNLLANKIIELQEEGKWTLEYVQIDIK